MDLGALGDIIGGVASVGSGGIFGLVGSLTSGFFKGRQEKQRQGWEEKKWSHEENLFKLNMEQANQETENELAITAQVGSFQGLTESINADASVGNTHMFVNDIKSLFRPCLTVGLWVIATLVFFKITSGSIGDFTEDEIKELVRYMVQTVFFCASTASVWWFGDRALAPPGVNRR